MVNREELNRKSMQVLVALRQKGIGNIVIEEMPTSVKTAQEAAVAVGCLLSQIAKSLIFQCVDSGKLILVIASGSNHVDTEIIGKEVGESVILAKPEIVEQLTGYEIGGVPPVGHITPLFTIIDEDLMKLERICAAAGTHFSVFKATPAELLKATGGKVMPVSKRE